MKCFKGIIISILVVFLLSGCGNYASGDQQADGQTDNSLGNIKEAEQLEQQALELARGYKEMYVGMDKGESLNAVISEESIRAIIDQFDQKGYTATGYKQNMVNYQQFEQFLNNAREGQEGEASYYYIRNDGGFFSRIFHSKDESLYVNTLSLSWNDEMEPVISYTSQYAIDQWDYTGKGYFIYATDNDRYPFTLQRINPRGEKECELSRIYIDPIGYQGNNLFLTDWDQDSMEQIVFNDLYEYLYLIDNGTSFDYEGIGQIGGAEYEALFTKYFDVTSDFLRQNSSYYQDRDEYFWIHFSCDMQYTILFPAPEPEVVESRENEDGSITMVVDALYEHYGLDRAFTHEVTVRINEDGSFQYLSNYIRPEDRESVPSYDARPVYYFNLS